MSAGIYVHIPYCLQKCLYCDFATVPYDHELRPKEYTQTVLEEIRNRAPAIPFRKSQSLYFGGGTPSLLPIEDIVAIRSQLAKSGFEFAEDFEFTIEINPGTVDDKKLDLYLAAGVNRYSVGVQTFNESMLQSSGREHSAEDSRKTLALLKRRGLNYSFDLLFGLPGQSLADLQLDLEELKSFDPPHVSLYNLTVPEKHPMNRGRAPDETQAEMFNYIENSLEQIGIRRYEVSNFSRPGFESRHNQLYWSDAPYWGIGQSAHSYFPSVGPWGTRFWNPYPIKEYVRQAKINQENDFYLHLPKNQLEQLKMHESLTDFLHTQLRMTRGLSLPKLTQKFGAAVTTCVAERLTKLASNDLVQANGAGYALSPKGMALANQVFLALTFLDQDLPAFES